MVGGGRVQLGAYSGKAAPAGGPPGPEVPLRKGRGPRLWLWAVTSRPEPAARSPELGANVEKSSLLSDLTSFVLSTQVSAVPTVLAMKNGDVVDKFVGIKDEDQLEAFLKKLIG